MIGCVAALLVAAVVALPGGTDVDYQLGGATEPAANVGIVVRDRTDPPAAGRYNVCYVNGFQTQTSEKAFWRKHRDLVLRDADGRPVVDEAWGEFLLDVRTADKRQALARIMGRWVRGCAAHGYAAVEFDNLDSFTRSDGLISAPPGDPLRRAAGRRGARARPGRRPEEPGRLRRDHDRLRLRGRRGVRPLRRVPALRRRLRRPGADDRVPRPRTSSRPAPTSAAPMPSSCATAT